MSDMETYIILHDLFEKKDNQILNDQIERIAGSIVRVASTAYVIRTDLTASKIALQMDYEFARADVFYVFPIHGKWAGETLFELEFTLSRWLDKSAPDPDSLPPLPHL